MLHSKSRYDKSGYLRWLLSTVCIFYGQTTNVGIKNADVQFTILKFSIFTICAGVRIFYMDLSLLRNWC